MRDVTLRFAMLTQRIFTERSRSNILKSKFFYLLPIISYLLPSPAYADVVLKDKFAFGWIGNLGQGVSLLVRPAFSIATTLVVIYFMFASFRLLSSGGDKEAVAGARAMITHSIIGFFILMMLFLVLQFLLSSLFGITSLKIIEGL